MAHRRDERREVVHGADEDDAERDPEHARHPAELLAGEDRPGDRAGRGDRAEVLPEQVEGPRRDEVDAVVDASRRAWRARRRARTAARRSGRRARTRAPGRAARARRGGAGASGRGDTGTARGDGRETSRNDPAAPRGNARARGPERAGDAPCEEYPRAHACGVVVVASARSPRPRVPPVGSWDGRAWSARARSCAARGPPPRPPRRARCSKARAADDGRLASDAIARTACDRRRRPATPADRIAHAPAAEPGGPRRGDVSPGGLRPGRRPRTPCERTAPAAWSKRRG